MTRIKNKIIDRIRKGVFFAPVLLSCIPVDQTKKAPLIPRTNAESRVGKTVSFLAKYNVKVQLNNAPLTRETFDAAINVFISGMQMHGVDASVTAHALQNTTVIWTDQPPANTLAMTLRHEVHVKWAGNIVRSSLYHEWLHSVLFSLVRTTDPEHTSLWWRTLLPDILELAADAKL